MSKREEILFLHILFFIVIFFVGYFIESEILSSYSFEKCVQYENTSKINDYGELLKIHQNKILSNLALLFTVLIFTINFVGKPSDKTEFNNFSKFTRWFFIGLIFFVTLFIALELLFLEIERNILLRKAGLQITVEEIEGGYGIPLILRHLIGRSLSFATITCVSLLMFYLIKKLEILKK